MNRRTHKLKTSIAHLRPDVKDLLLDVLADSVSSLGICPDCGEPILVFDLGEFASFPAPGRFIEEVGGAGGCPGGGTRAAVSVFLAEDLKEERLRLGEGLRSGRQLPLENNGCASCHARPSLPSGHKSGAVAKRGVSQGATAAGESVEGSQQWQQEPPPLLEEGCKTLSQGEPPPARAREEVSR
jgi:hypothetical protein